MWPTKPKTHNSYRSIPFMAEIGEILLSKKEKQNRQKKVYGNRWRSSGEFDNLVFTTSLGSPVIRNVAEKEIKKVVKAINFQEAIEAVKENKVVQCLWGTSITVQRLIYILM